MERIYVGEVSDKEKEIYSLEEAQSLIEGNGGYSARIVSWRTAVKVAKNPDNYSAALLFAASDKLDSLMAYYIHHEDYDNYLKTKELQDNIINALK